MPRQLVILSLQEEVHQLLDQIRRYHSITGHILSDQRQVFLAQQLVKALLSVKQIPSAQKNRYLVHRGNRALREFIA